MEAETAEGTTDASGNGLGGAADQAAEAKARLEEVQAEARSLIREYPLACLAAAVVAGYIAARLLPRI